MTARLLVVQGRSVTSKHRLHEVDIEGYGPLTILGLSKRQISSCHSRAGENDDLRAALIFRLGVSKNKRLWAMDEPELTAEFEGRDGVLERILTAVLERSWPRVEI